MRQVTLLTAVAVSALVELDRRARAVDCTLTLVNVPPRPYRSLYLAGLIGALDIHPTPAI